MENIFLILILLIELVLAAFSVHKSVLKIGGISSRVIFFLAWVLYSLIPSLFLCFGDIPYGYTQFQAQWFAIHVILAFPFIYYFSFFFRPRSRFVVVRLSAFGDFSVLSQGKRLLKFMLIIYSLLVLCLIFPFFLYGEYSIAGYGREIAIMSLSGSIGSLITFSFFPVVSAIALLSKSRLLNIYLLIPALHFFLQGNRNIALGLFLAIFLPKLNRASTILSMPYLAIPLDLSTHQVDDQINKNTRKRFFLIAGLTLIVFILFQIWSFWRNFSLDEFADASQHFNLAKILSLTHGELGTSFRTSDLIHQNPSLSNTFFPLFDSYIYYPALKIISRVFGVESTGPAVIISYKYGSLLSPNGNIEGLGFSWFAESLLNLGGYAYIILIPFYVFLIEWLYSFYRAIVSSVFGFDAFAVFIAINLQRIDFSTIFIFYVVCLLSSVLLSCLTSSLIRR